MRINFPHGTVLIFSLQFIDQQSRRHMLFVSVLVVIGAVVSALVPLALKELIDRLSTMPDVSDVLPLFAWGAAYVCADFATRMTAESRDWCFGRLEHTARRRMSIQLYEHVIALPLAVHLESHAGALTETIEQGIDGAQALLRELLSGAVPVCIELICVCIILLQLGHAEYLAVLMMGLIAFIWTQQRSAATSRAAAGAVATAHVASRSIYPEALHSVETVKCLGLEPYLADRFRRQANQLHASWLAYFHHVFVNGSSQALVTMSCVAFTTALGVRDALQGELSIGEFVMLQSFVLRMLQPLESMSLALRRSAQAIECVRPLMRFWDQRSESLACDDTSQGVTILGCLQVENVCLGYSGRTVLSAVSFAVGPGKVLGIAGGSGCGKSSLLRLLMRVYEPDHGGVCLDGKPMQQWALPAWRSAFRVVLQDVVLFHASIADNILCGREASSDELNAVLELACLQPLLSQLPTGMQTVIGERGLKLSGGERQRLAIARALLRTGAVCILDEATSALDSTTERCVLMNVRRALHDCSLIIVSHRLATLVDCDEILFLSDGRIAERGTHDALLASGGGYAAMWAAQHTCAATDPWTR